MHFGECIAALSGTVWCFDNTVIKLFFACSMHEWKCSFQIALCKRDTWWLTFIIADSASLHTWFHSSHLNRRLWDHLHSILLGWDLVIPLTLARRHLQQLVIAKFSSQELHRTAVIWLPHIQGDMISSSGVITAFDIFMLWTAILLTRHQFLLPTTLMLGNASNTKLSSNVFKFSPAVYRNFKFCGHLDTKKHVYMHTQTHYQAVIIPSASPSSSRMGCSRKKW